ncbi:MAG: TonB-dependent receptor [Flavobacteriaceae bacterium]|nr:TonB-dependent receptor [Flavobacteriaceae bacterium]
MKTKLSGIITLFLAFMVQITFAQEKTITGTVSDETGALPGVSVIIEGTTSGTETDFDGNFTINAKMGDVLRFSFIGMTPVTRVVGDQNVVNVTLVSESNTLDEVVVTGFSNIKRSELTGSAVQLSSETLTQIPVASVDQVLQGRVAGLSISGTSGTPGSEQNIRIRGISSITAGNEPLYVIDGVPIADNDITSDDVAGSTLSTLSTLSANNIESITVLKDASATAPYGARGANGVIVITTKSGKDGKTKFNFSSSVGFSNDAIDDPKVLTAAQQEPLFYEAIVNSFGVPIEDAPDFAVNVLGISDWADWNANGRQEANWGEAIKNKNAVQSDYNLSATGGDEKSSFFASLGMYDSEATVIGADYKRYTGALNFSRNLTDDIKFSTINNVSNSFQNGILEQSAYFSSPRTAKFFLSPRDMPYNPDGSINFNVGFTNPLWVTQNDLNETRLTRLLSNNTLAWDTPVENLKFTTRFAIDYQVYDNKQYWNRQHGDGESTDGYASRWNRNITNYVFQNTLDYGLFLGDNHKFDFKLVQEYQENRLYELYADGEKFAADGLTNLDNAGSPLSANSSFYDWKIASYTGMFNYSFSSKYILNASYRREGNSRFSQDNLWGNFWAVGAAWNLHNEDFMDGSSDFLSNLKLRGSYGVTGNANIGLNLYQVKLGFDSNYAGSAGIYPAGYGNDDLTWETQSTLDAGLDFGFIENRITGSFSYYYRESEDLLLNVPLSLTTGFSGQTANIGTMYNTGVEAELNFDIIRKDNLNFSIGGYMSTTKNEVTELALDTEGNPRTITTGTRKVDVDHTVYEYFLVKFAGVDPETGVNTYYLNGKDGETTENFSEAQREFQGTSALPTFTAGMNFHFDFAGFFLDATGYYAGGHQVYEGWHRYVHGSDLYNTWLFNSINTLEDRWQQPGDITRVEKPTFGTKPWQRHTNYLHDGDYFRLKDVTFGYDLKPEWSEQIGLQSARFFVRATNAYTWVKDENLLYDPEVDPSGSTGLTTPAVKTVSFGVNINF